MLKLIISVYVLVALSQVAFSQMDSLNMKYKQTYDSLESYLNNPIKNKLFKKAVFLVENTYLKEQIEYNFFESSINDLVNLAHAWMHFNNLHSYKFSDSLQVIKNLAIYKVLKDTVRILINLDQRFKTLPYTYDFNDFFGEKEWSNMFVTKLLATHSGNCHSLPYLYKILADELGAQCWLTLAPNHIYIKNRCKSIGWYNTELTSGDFPIDAWIMASGYLPLQAIQNGIYMDTLSNQEDIALCVLDLAKGYEHQTHNYYDGFILKCCDLSLQYFPKNVQAMLLKAETLKHIYQKEQKEKIPEASDTFNKMQDLYIHLYDLGYREMPDNMYMKWLQSVMKEKGKYANQKAIHVMQDGNNK